MAFSWVIIAAVALSGEYRIGPDFESVAEQGTWILMAHMFQILSSHKTICL